MHLYPDTGVVPLTHADLLNSTLNIYPFLHASLKLYKFFPNIYFTNLQQEDIVVGEMIFHAVYSEGTTGHKD